MTAQTEQKVTRIETNETQIGRKPTATTPNRAATEREIEAYSSAAWRN